MKEEKMSVFKAYGEGNKKETIYLRVENQGHNVNLIACDGNGYRIPGGHILAVLPKGEIRLFQNVSNKLGFKLDKEGRVIVELH